MDGIRSKTRQKIKDVAKAVAKQTKFEVQELSTHTLKQVVGGPGEVHPEVKNQTSPISEAMQQTSGPSLTPDELKKKRLAFIDRVKKAEEELKKAEIESKKKLEAWRGNVTQSMQVVAPGEPMEERLVIPQSAPSRGRGKKTGIPGTEPGVEIRKSKQ